MMKRILIVTTILFSFAAMTAAAQAQTRNPEAEKQAALTEQLIEKVKKLRLELLQQSVEFQQWKLKQIERELQQVEAEQKRFEEENRTIEQALAALAISSEQQKEDDSLKVEAERRLQRLRTRHEPVRERISELTEQQIQEEMRMRQIITRLKSETGAQRK